MTPNYFNKLQFYPSLPSLSSILPFPRRSIYHLLHLYFFISYFFHFCYSSTVKELKSLFSCSLISSYIPFHISFSHIPYLSISFHTGSHRDQTQLLLVNTFLSRNFSCCEFSIIHFKHFGIQNQTSSKQPLKILQVTVLLYTNTAQYITREK